MFQISANATSTGTLASSAAGFNYRLTGVLIRDGGTAGTVTLKDGGSSGTEKLVINTPARVGYEYIPIPGDGMLFQTDIHVTLSQADGVTITYEKRSD